MYRDPKKHEINPAQVANSELCPKKKGKQAVLNYDWLTNEYQQAMLSALFLAPSIAKEDRPLNILHLGTGAGVMAMFLASQLGDKLAKITTVDNFQDMLTLAQNYFGF